MKPQSARDVASAGTPWTLVLLAGLGFSCSPSEPDSPVRVVEQQLGSLSSVSCDLAQRTALRHEMIAAEARVQSDSYQQCLSTFAERLSYVPCDEDEWNKQGDASYDEVAAFVAALLRNKNPIQIQCVETGNCGESHGGLILGCTSQFEDPEYVGLQEFRAEPAFFSRLGNYAGPETYDALVGLTGGMDTIYHELMHTYGFKHYQERGNFCLENDPKTGIPDIAGICASVDIGNRHQQPQCNDGGEILMGGECLPFLTPSGFTPQPNPDLTGFGDVVAVGDFDGDGFDDIAATGFRHYGPTGGAPDGYDRRAIRLYYGTAFGLTDGGMLWDTTVGRVALVSGDFNLDGFDDIAVGMPDNGNGVVRIDWGGWDGLKSVSTGGPGTTAVPTPPISHYLVGEAAGDQFGASLATGHSRNNPDSPFLAIGAPGKSGRGAVYVYGTNGYLTSEPLKNLYVYAPSTLNSGDEFGASLSTLPRNGESMARLLIGAPGTNGDRGAGYLISTFNLVHGTGETLLSTSQNPNAEPGDRTGESVAYGSLGYGEDERVGISLGAPAASRVDFFSKEGDYRFSLESEGDKDFGRNLAWSPPKFGRRYLTIGAPEEGVVRLISNKNAEYENEWNVTQVLGQRGLSDAEPNEQFGSAFGWGDFDGDGAPDLAVGTPGEKFGQSGIQTGGLHTFQWDQDDFHEDGTTSCNRLVPWKAHSTFGGVGDAVPAIRPWAWFTRIGADGAKKGDVIRFGCAFYEAKEATDESPSENPDAWSIVQNLLGQVNAPRTLGFPELAGAWVNSWNTLGEFIYDEVNFTEGANSLGMVGVGYHNITSEEFYSREFSEIGSMVTLDVYVPRKPAGIGYDGAIDIHVSIPDLENQVLGHIELMGLATGQWHSLSVPFPEPFLSAFLQENILAKFHLAINSHVGEPEGLRIDHLRFTGELTKHPFHQSATSITQTTSSSPFICEGACLTATPMARWQQSGVFGNSEGVWFVAGSDLSGWQASEVPGRTIEVNGVEVVSGEMPLPAPIDGKYYFYFSEGTQPWASWTYW